MFQKGLVSLVDFLVDDKYFGQIRGYKNIQFSRGCFLDSTDINSVDLSNRSCSFLKYKDRIERLICSSIDGT